MLIGLFLLAWLTMAIYQASKPLPTGLSLQGPWRPAEDVRLLLDQTWQQADGERLSEQEIFDEALGLIGQARHLVVVDMFLFNDFAGQGSYRPLSAELAGALIDARARAPALEAVLITDPFNSLYGGLDNPLLEQLQQAGVTVISTPLQRLPASNPAWTGLWALCCSFVGNSSSDGWLPSPVGEQKITLRSYLALLNFRANHRKTLIVDQGDDWVGLVTSANPHDGSSRHSNQALRFRGAAALDLLASEAAVARLAGYDSAHWPQPPDAAPIEGNEPRLRVLSEGKVRDALLAMVDEAAPGERLDIAVFYIAHRPLAEALIRAHQRGVHVRLLLDPNRDAFGREKNGIPNRPFAWDLHEQGIEVRWFATSGEQGHRKLMLWTRQDGSAELLSGSANFTQRNLDDLNLETDVQLRGSAEYPPLARVADDFERLWSNAEGRTYSLSYQAFADHSRWRYGLYRVMEWSGMSTF
ncbi:phospholipase D-like domain-containing protein [Pseudomonas mangrovi]|nr:phospholipase D-like domain-containing protein [Pseudomonas mangrovi]